MDPSAVLSSLQRLPTGIRDLDPLLGGGVPVASVTMITGEPGVGKTVLTLQVLFNLARQGRRCLYFSTLSEPSIKVVRYLQSFSFFDASLLDNGVCFADLGSLMRAEGPEVALKAVAERVETEEPDVVVIDSFKAVHDMTGDPARSRSLVYDLAVHMASWGTTTFLVGEYSTHDVAALPEFAVADGIIRLRNSEQELSRLREFEVLKLRGSQYVSGRHFFEIFPHGVEIYPRVRGPQNHSRTFDVRRRVKTGVPGLDEMLGGGVPHASATVLEGGTGTGKTLLGLHFLLEGIKNGERGVLFTLEETAEQLHAVAANFGWDLEAMEGLSIRYQSPVELSTDRFLQEARRMVEQVGARRAVLDSLSSLSLGVASTRRFKELVYALVKHFRALDATLLLTVEVPELLGTAQLTGHGISSVADNLIRLRYVEIAGGLERAIAVIKARGVQHQTALREMYIDEQGARVGERFHNLRGVLTGVPAPAQNA